MLGLCCPTPDGAMLACCDALLGGEKRMQEEWRSLIYVDHAGVCACLCLCVCLRYQSKDDIIEIVFLAIIILMSCFLPCPLFSISILPSHCEENLFLLIVESLYFVRDMCELTDMHMIINKHFVLSTASYFTIDDLTFLSQITHHIII